MRSKSLGYALAFAFGLGLTAAGNVVAQPRSHARSSEVGGDKTIDKQLEWENKVMGDDGGKAAEIRKINAAQKMADEAAKRPPPVQAPKVKDPNKEGVRAKQEAAIGLPIASDQEARVSKVSKTADGRTSASHKKSAQPSSANDELGALVATSLAEEKSTDVRSSGAQNASASGKIGRGAKGKGKGRVKPAAAPSTLDQMFANSK